MGKIVRLRKIKIGVRRKIVFLRKRGLSIPEIHQATGVAKTTVQRYVKTIKVPKKFISRLREKQGGSKSRASARKENSLHLASKVIGHISKREAFLVLVGLYWGEGTKTDFSMINSDPTLIKFFVSCLSIMNIDRDRLTVSLRVHNGVSLRQAVNFWSKTTGVESSRIISVEKIVGSKKGKLKYGMCRVRVRSGIKERLLIQSAIELVGKQLSKV